MTARTSAGTGSDGTASTAGEGAGAGAAWPCPSSPQRTCLAARLKS